MSHASKNSIAIILLACGVVIHLLAHVFTMN